MRTDGASTTVMPGRGHVSGHSTDDVDERYGVVTPLYGSGGQVNRGRRLSDAASVEQRIEYTRNWVANRPANLSSASSITLFH